MKANYKAVLVALFLFLAFALAASADRITVTINERGKVISYYNEYYIVNVNGTITIYNPYNFSLDTVRVPCDLNTLSIKETTSEGYLTQNGIIIPFMEAHETIEMEYEIRGITATNPMYRNYSVLRTAMLGQQPTMYPPLVQNIKKAPVENVSIDSGAIKAEEKRRLIVVTVTNPADIVVNITKISVIKTAEANPNEEIKKWEFDDDGSNIVMQPNSIWTYDLIDYNSSDGEVYWLSLDVSPFIDVVINGTNTISTFSEKDVINIENTTSVEKGSYDNVTSYLEHIMYLKKYVSKTQLVPGDKVKVTIRVNNFAPVSRRIELKDSIPFGFRLIEDNKSNFSYSNSMVSWQTMINPDSSRVFSYQLLYYDNESLGIDYFDAAELSYENTSMFSQRIPFIRQYIPEKKIYVQKKVSYGLDNEVKVTIQLQNLGEDSIKDVYLKEFLASRDDFRELTKKPERKGVWHIPVLKRNEVWEVSYVTNENSAINKLPVVLGVDKKLILKSFVFENIIRNSWIIGSVSYFEYIGLSFLIIFPIAFIIYNRRKRYRREYSLRKLSRDIKRLKDETEPEPSEAIDVLKKEISTTKRSLNVPKFNSPKQETRKKDKIREMAHKNIDELKRLKDL